MSVLQFCLDIYLEYLANLVNLSINILFLYLYILDFQDQLD